MAEQLALSLNSKEHRAVSPLDEMGANEALWSDPNTTFKRIDEYLRGRPDALLSDMVSVAALKQFAAKTLQLLKDAQVRRFGVRVHGTCDYPKRLTDAQYPVRLLYFQGLWDLAFATKSVAIVGTRNPSPAGLGLARALASFLARKGFTIASGLARGIDTEVHRSTLRAGGITIAVIGTPLSEVYPKENAALQREIAKNFLVVSQVPVCRYSQQDYRRNRLFFPERNITMSALTQATIIVEAGETSGTLIQARAALAQGRKLFIMEQCFADASLTWPRRYLHRGAIRIRDFSEIERHLEINQD